jgi:hypothetical protein
MNVVIQDIFVLANTYIQQIYLFTRFTPNLWSKNKTGHGTNSYTTVLSSIYLSPSQYCSTVVLD